MKGIFMGNNDNILVNQSDESQTTSFQNKNSAINDLPRLASPNQVSLYTGIPTNTLAFWRFEGSHLPFVKMGRLIRYRREDVLSFINNNVFSSTAEAKAAA